MKTTSISWLPLRALHWLIPLHLRMSSFPRITMSKCQLTRFLGYPIGVTPLGALRYNKRPFGL
ncbi:hypothetical protein BT63DRAFT_422984 [Microthyrium microscopicum]|uniref:Uncharacterized protein n=1 Tax=Microthyrium microscopicum TaxID=703497 RepID=A0A6A6UJZ5_9PEZI|nr:hypothetical protein BT63DRAFT_422984 [Microthyrium microscopicum]